MTKKQQTKKLTEVFTNIENSIDLLNELYEDQSLKKYNDMKISLELLRQTYL